jgi:hypothetical protein
MFPITMILKGSFKKGIMSFLFWEWQTQETKIGLDSCRKKSNKKIKPFNSLEIGKGRLFSKTAL